MGTHKRMEKVGGEQRSSPHLKLFRQNGFLSSCCTRVENGKSSRSQSRRGASWSACTLLRSCSRLSCSSCCRLSRCSISEETSSSSSSTSCSSASSMLF
jgi:hypothetical protein